MSELLKIGQTVYTDSSNAPCKIEKFLGGGGQGEVYQARLGNNPVAVKWYFPHYYPHQDPELKTRLEMAIKRGAPNDRFLWPQELVTAERTPTFGYVMPLREPRFKNLNDMMAGRANPGFRAVATAGFELANSYSKLHANGLCYKDISFGNVFLDPDSGEIRVCDNDNVDVNGKVGAIGGTQGFMAPEVELGKTPPNTHTDLHSLAVLLFYMFMMGHPLNGKREYEIRCLNPAAKRKLYGEEPLFIFDPSDSSNAPVPGEHDNPLAHWPIYPQALQNLFTRSFTISLRDPSTRVREEEWKKAMIRLRDSIIYCGRCDRENFYDMDKMKAAGGKPGVCWNCQAELQLPPRIRIGTEVTMLNRDSALYPHHIDPDRKYDFSKPMACMNQNPKDGRWGLKNTGADNWTTTFPDGRIMDIEGGRSVPVAVGIKINFGKVEGEVRHG